MYSSFLKRQFFLANKNINENCFRITMNSIKRITDKYNLEKKEPKFKNPLFDDPKNDKPNINFYGVLAFISISSLIVLFYKKIK